MVEELAKDYSNYFKKVDILKEINPISSSIEEMLARLEEFEGLLTTLKIDSNNIMQNTIPQILSQKPEFDELYKRIDNFEKFIGVVNENLNVVEEKLNIAEEELNVPDYSLKSLFKPFFTKSKNDNQKSSNLKDGNFEPLEVFKTSDYFGNTTSQ